MYLSKNQVLITNTDVFQIINQNTTNKLDISFVEKEVSYKEFEKEFRLLNSRNLPMLNSILKAVYDGNIIFCKADTANTSLVYMFGMASDGAQINKVFINLTRFVKKEKQVDENGNLREFNTFIGGDMVLYELLLPAFVAFKAQRVFQSPTVVSTLSELYVDIMSQLISRNFGNPIDGEKFRFMTKFFFFQRQVPGQTLAESSRYEIGKYRSLELKYPEFFNGTGGLTITQYCDVIAKEFPSIGRNKFSPSALIVNSISSLGDSGVYLLDNMAYFLAIVVSKARHSKIFTGYMLKSIERNSSRILSPILQSLG